MFLLLCTSLLSRGGIAQSVYGTIRGTLKLGTGAPISQALVFVSALDKGDVLKLSGRTDAAGYYIFSNVPPGAYTMSIRKDGYKTYEEPIVSVSADNTSEVNVKLTQGNLADKEVGDGSAVSILKVDRTDVSTTFTPGEIDALPIFLQNMSLYELIVPGAVPTIAVLSSEQNLQSGRYVSISGQHFSGTSFLLDGATNRDPLQGIIVLNPSLESVSEVKVTTQNYSAEFGPATGGVVSMQTRSGTNTLHGAVYDYRQFGFGQASLPDFRRTSVVTSSTQERSDFGAALGGPLERNRLFVFGDYRGVRKSAGSTVLLTVPTKTVHDTCLGPHAPATMPNCDLSEYIGKGVKFNPPYSNGLLPNSILSRQMLYFFTMIPMPKFPGVTNNYTASGVDTYSNDSFNIRPDYVASSNLSLFGRYSFANFKENGAPAFGAAGGIGTNPSNFAGKVKDRNQGISAGFSYNLTSNLLTDFRFGFFRYNLALDSLDEGTTPATQAGINGLNFDFYSSGMPDIQLTNPNVPGLPIAGGNSDFLRLGYSGAVNSCNCPLREREQQFQFVSNWTTLRGKHKFRWGADIRYLQNYRLDSNNRRAGHLTFSSNVTGFSLGDFLLGAVSNFSRAYNRTVTNAGERQNRLFFYGEDTWRVTSRLTLNYGLRWEIYLPQSVTGTGEGAWLQLGSGTTPADDQFLVGGQAGINLQGDVKTTLRNFGPRLGLAYLVNRDTVVRAGYGRAFDPGWGGSIFGIAATQSPPVGDAITVKTPFAINSSSTPVASHNPLFNICVINESCTFPPFTIPQDPFTIRDLYNANTITIPTKPPNPQSPFQQANLYALPRRLRLPTVDAWNIAVQHALDRHTYFEIAYVGNKGTHVLNDSLDQVPYYDLNEPTLVGYIAPVSPRNCQNPIGVHDKFCKTRQQIRQSFQPWTSEIRYFGNDASSNYNSLQVKVRRQLSSGFSMLAAYTWAKLLDYDNIYYAIDPKVSHGVGNFDRTHSFVMTNTWSLPLGRGHTLLGEAGPVLDKIVGGWSLATITLVSSGRPFTPTYSGSRSGSGCDDDIGTSNYRPCRPNLVGTVHIMGNRTQYFTTTGGSPLTASGQGFNPQTGVPQVGETIGPWQRPGAGQIGDAGRNSLRGPGFFQADLAVAKEVAIKEGISLRFRADAFNVFNKVNLANPNPVVDSAGGGKITSLAPSAVQRQLQFSLRVEF